MKKNENIRVMTGNEAIAEGALAAGLLFYAGYPITPSSEIAEELSICLPKIGGIFIQMEDEIASMGAIIGASLAGKKSMTATSGPGFSLMQENIGYAAMAEVPCVVVNVMRGGPSTGLPTLPAQGDVMQARWGTHGDHQIIVLTPNSVRETYDLIIRAFNLSEKYRTPVIFLIDEIIGHINEKVQLPDPSEYEIIERTMMVTGQENFLPYQMTESDIPPMISFGQGYRFHVTGLAHDETGFPTNSPAEISKLMYRLDRKISRYRNDIIEVEELMLDDADIVVFAYGSTSRSARQAVKMARTRGTKVGMLRSKVLWPFPDKEIKQAIASASKVIVPELNLGQIAHEVEWASAGKVEVHRLSRVDGEPISPLAILEKIEEIA